VRGTPHGGKKLRVKGATPSGGDCLVGEKRWERGTGFFPGGKKGKAEGIPVQSEGQGKGTIKGGFWEGLSKGRQSEKRRAKIKEHCFG